MCLGLIGEILKKHVGENEPKNSVQFILKVNNVLETEIAHELGKDSGGIELVDIKGKDVYVKLTGTCSGCKNALNTLRNFVEKKLRELVDEEINVIEVK